MKFDRQLIYYSANGIHVELGPKDGAIATPHSHDNQYQIEILTSGLLRNLSDDNALVYEPGTISVFNPGDPHRVDYLGSDSLFFFVDVEAMRRIFREAERKIDEPLYSPHQKVSLSLPLPVFMAELDALKRLGPLPQGVAKEDPALQIFREEKIFGLLRAALRDLDPSAFKRIGTYHMDVMVRVRRWIDENHQNENLNITAMANQSRLSPFHFVRVFKSTVGKTPYEYLASVRAGAALQILKRRPKTSLAEVAAAVGFRTPAQLRYQVRRLHGSSPTKLFG